ncbi:BPSS1187 family protein [Rhabdochromatium marinum]|uniref:BPSS1187 family protein n=1 Tax=Rhabdochromatium marinum TaxID=48729 RepID=UPI0019044DE1|nr:hypothetical protein [Rhabdochromatium marinum]MBK1649996.1 hypothetical protein [Rhabdochromatium marinum]
MLRPRQSRRLQPHATATIARAPNEPWSAEIAPEHCDPSIDQWRDAHLVMRAATPNAQGQLFLFLCGSYGIPARQRLITTVAAQLGYHAINLSYPNAWTVGGLCQDSRDPDCHGQVRLDLLDGGQRSGLLTLAPAQAIEPRLRALLKYLITQYPEQGWEQFLTSAGAIQWPKLVVAGHSQGGGHAAMIGKCHPVARVVMLAAPADYVRTIEQQARWLNMAGATPASRHFGFVHAQDQGFEKILRSWELLGLDIHSPVEVDDAEPPYQGAQCLITTITGVRREKYHASVAQDNLTPSRVDGRALFEPVWRYLLSPERLNADA